MNTSKPKILKFDENSVKFSQENEVMADLRRKHTQVQNAHRMSIMKRKESITNANSHRGDPSQMHIFKSSTNIRIRKDSETGMEFKIFISNSFLFLKYT